ncbi:MAG: UDP-N-acetylmuramoyl-tripeptide--D-alanyl-D-alanine ligase [Acidobacteria bacterium]|nr:UDP-N-acetylmuramoyl-tripeptide--D-alanyl-D-alanine ligase [Acidobacteriota bacterium]
MCVSAVPHPAKVTGWSVDSRTIAPGDLYFALRGPNHDGHDYVQAALEKGAVGAVVEHPAGTADHLLIVPDTLRALQAAASWARNRWDAMLIAVTGSAGKTTTKDAIAHLLSGEMPVGKTVGNWNNHVGVPLSILRMPPDCRVGVLEIGMNHPGEIRALAAIAKPNIGVVTNVGSAHVENFDSIEGVALAKRELIEALPEDGVAVLNADDPRVLRFREAHRGPRITYGFSETAAVRAEDVEYGANGTRFRIGRVAYETTLSGRHGVMNMLAALAVAAIFEIPPERLRDPVRSFAPGKMRGERLEHRGIIVWNDCYNSNPEAACAMLDVLKSTPAKRRVAVLGEMLELGRSAEALHRDVGRYVAGRGIDVLIGIRGAARYMVDEAVRAGLSDGAAHFFEDPAEAGEFARALLASGDAVLFKGSRGVQVERALERFLV